MTESPEYEGAAQLAADAAERMGRLDWNGIVEALDTSGYASVPALLNSGDCEALAALYAQDSIFRSRVNMSSHGFGSGEYKYFDYPLPDTVAAIRDVAYTRLAATANQWHERLQIAARFPPKHSDYLRTGRDAGRRRPTPLILRYRAGDYNCLHQDLYGEYVFPIQLTVLLSDPSSDFDGGEFVITQQRPRMQSRAQVVELGKGDGIFFAVNFRPVHGSRGFYRVRVRHGVSTIRSGNRYALGVVLHDAR
jgi:uncharacterized protein